MFILTKIADLVQIAPEDFRKTSFVAIRDNINAKYANKVIQRTGLCICLYDILWISEGLIGHGTGLVNINGDYGFENWKIDKLPMTDSGSVEFRIIVFRPYQGEVILARIRSSTPAGIHLRTDFFDDIFVHSEDLPQDAEYNHAQQLWIWRVGDDRLFYDQHEMVRVQISDEEWHDQTPAGPMQAAEDVVLAAPYRIKGSMAREGLGVCLWWDHADGEDEDS